MVTLSQVKSILGITDTSQDSQLQSILDGVNALASSFIDIAFGEKTELLYKKAIRNDILLCTYTNPSKLTSVNGVDFSGKVSGVDYMILPNGSMQVPNLCSYTTSTSFDYYEVKYESGYATLPSDYVGAIAMYVGSLSGNTIDQQITEETTGPRTVKWSDAGKSASNTMTPQEKFYKFLRKYIPIHLTQY